VISGITAAASPEAAIAELQQAVRSVGTLPAPELPRTTLRQRAGA
jgi:hypothetical protein